MINQKAWFVTGAPEGGGLTAINSDFYIQKTVIRLHS